MSNFNFEWDQQKAAEKTKQLFELSVFQMTLKEAKEQIEKLKATVAKRDARIVKLETENAYLQKELDTYRAMRSKVKESVSDDVFNKI